jgi:preprotein translocase subunit SecY
MKLTIIKEKNIMAKKQSIAKMLDNLPWLVRLLLVILYGAYGNLVRLFKSLEKGNMLGVVLAVVLLLTGGFVILWVADLICVILNRPIWWIDR